MNKQIPPDFNWKVYISMNSDIKHITNKQDAIKHYYNDKLVYNYVRGGCGLECASNMKYALEYWEDINSVQPLIGCLEKKATYECHPSVEQVITIIKDEL